MIDFDLLKTICETPGAPGFEKPIRDLVLDQLKSISDEVSVDAMGNVIAIKKGKDRKRVMIAAHLDEISFIVTHIDDDGFIRFHTLGGFDPKTLTAQRVIIHGREDVIGVMGSKPIHLMQAEERNKAPNIKDYYIDTGLTGKEVKALISVGDPITRERSLIKMGNCVNGKSLDNRVSVYILLKTMAALKERDVPYDVYGTFTVQEEVGLRGAMSSAGHINPHFGFGLDVTVAFDLPGAQPHEVITKLGEGAAIKIMDGSTICDYRMVQYLKKLADEKNIKWQPEILTAGGTDTAGIQRYGKDGSIAGAISIPLRHLHQVIEMAHTEDIDHCIALLTEAVANLDQYDWST
ncbi:MAG: M42 family metallopeptidase [Saprospiraceae bacterium]|nr:M42 family metallopeptidase [Saprospiraceae bacterium]